MSGIIIIRDKEVFTAERAQEKQRIEESLVESKMNVILDSGLFSKVIVVRSTVLIRVMIIQAIQDNSRTPFHTLFTRSRSFCLTKRNLEAARSPCRLL